MSLPIINSETHELEYIELEYLEWDTLEEVETPFILDGNYGGI